MDETSHGDTNTSSETRNNPVDVENYDFCSKRTHLTTPNKFVSSDNTISYRFSLIESVIHMLMRGLGGGLIGLHAAYMECGLITSTAVNVILAAIVGYSVCSLVWSAQKLYDRMRMPKLTYPDIMELAALLSPWLLFRRHARKFRYLVEVTLLCHLYGSCCVFIIMVARNLKELALGNITVSDDGEPLLRMVILSLIVPCAIICMVTNLKTLAPFALICDLFAVALVLVILWYSLHDIKVSPLDRYAFKSCTGLAQFICVCIFVLEPVCYALPIENNMAEPRKFYLVVLAAMPIYTLAMVTVGLFGYWYYGENAVAPITVHFPFSPFAVMLKAFLCVILYVIYAVYLYLAFDIEWHYLKQRHKPTYHWFWERLYRVLHVVTLTFIAYGLPNVTRLMAILGAVSTIPAVLIYPPLIDLLVNSGYPGVRHLHWKQLKCILLILLGFSMYFIGTAFNIIEMTRKPVNVMLHSQNLSDIANNQFWINGTDYTYDKDIHNITVNIPRETPDDIEVSIARVFAVDGFQNIIVIFVKKVNLFTSSIVGVIPYQYFKRYEYSFNQMSKNLKIK